MKRRRLLASLLVLGFAVTFVSVWLAREKAPAPRSRVGSAGVTIVLPNGWDTPSQAVRSRPNFDPLTRIVVSSAPIRFAAVDDCGPSGYAFGRTSVAIVVVEWVRTNPGFRFPPRPRHFTRKTLPLHKPPAIECFDGPGGSREFVENRRRLDAFLLLGRSASPRLADRARAALDTLQVKKRD